MDGLSHWFARGGEYLSGNADEMEAARTRLRTMLENAQVIAVAVLVASTVLVIFSLMIGGFSGALGLIPGVIGCLGGYDVMVACREGIPMTKNAANFTFFSSLMQSGGNDPTPRQIQAVQNAWMPMFKNTLVLGSFVNCLLE